MLEIERKFLVTGNGFRGSAVEQLHMEQGYLVADAARTVRIRKTGGRGYLTIKGPGSPDGTTRLEWERELDAEEAEALMALALPGRISKTRFTVPFGSKVFEVDVFDGENAGLVLAEIELESPGESFERPDWLGEEVTGDSRYYNAYLSRHPYEGWPKDSS